MSKYPPFTVVVAMTADYLIGQGNVLPWHLPEELREFRQLTWGGIVIMGRKTFAGLAAPLPGRTNLVVSRQPAASFPGVFLHSGLLPALQAAGRLSGPIFVIGGAELYKAAVPHAANLTISWIRGSYSGDTYFPSVFAEDWVSFSCEHQPAFSRCFYQRRNAESPASQREPGLRLLPPWTEGQ